MRSTTALKQVDGARGQAHISNALGHGEGETDHGIALPVSLLEHLESHRLKVLAMGNLRGSHGFLQLCGGMGWLVGVGGGWFRLGGSGAEGGSVVCASLFGRGNSGQTDLRKGWDVFLRRLS